MPETTQSSWIAPESPDLVWFTGADAERFLNDLISQEIGDMETGETRRSLLLGPKGKLDHVLWVLKDEDRIGLVTDPRRGEELAATLGRYRIRVDVEIEPETAPAWLVLGDGDGYDVSWTGVTRHLVIGERPDLPAGTVPEYESLRIGAGEPRWSVDVDEKTIPQEAGLVDVSVDFTKGCYLGQELVARINSRGGNVPRRLRLVDLEERAEPGTPIMSGEKEVGTLTSTVGTVGMALIQRDTSPGDGVMVGSVKATVLDTPSKSQT